MQLGRHALELESGKSRQWLAQGSVSELKQMANELRVYDKWQAAISDPNEMLLHAMASK